MGLFPGLGWNLTVAGMAEKWNKKHFNTPDCFTLSETATRLKHSLTGLWGVL